MELVPGLLLLLACCLVPVLLLRRRWRNSAPPGPPSVPLLGCLPFLAVSRGVMSWVLDPRVTKHPLATVALGPRIITVINDLQLARQLFDRDEFNGRVPDKFLLSHRFWNNTPRGIIFTQGPHWAGQRRFGLRTLKDFGFGKKAIEEAIHFEVDEMMETCFAGSDDILLGTDFNIPIINILWQMVANKRFSPTDPKDQKLMERVSTLFAIGQFAVSLVPLPVFYLLPDWVAKHTMLGRRVDSLEGVRDHLVEEVKKHQVDHDPSNPRDFIDVYLNEEKKGGEEFNVLDLTACIHDFFVAGTETSSTTLKWILMHLVLNQAVQDRCREEIQNVLGGRKVTVSDMPSLPYVQATIAEVQRICWIAPGSLPHTTTKNTRVGDFTFPEKSTFIANLAFMMNDPRFFDQPEVFNPDRFLDSAGRFVKSDRLVPFGVGKRYCMGEPLARSEVFVFLVDLLQGLQFLPATSHPAPSPDNFLCNLTRVPDDFHLRVSRL